jgi:hypothetical protein
LYASPQNRLTHSHHYNIIKNILKKIIKKAKGVSKKVVEKNIDFIDYKNCVLENKDVFRNINSIRTSNMTNYSITQNKLALSNKDDKRVWEGTKSRAYGHFKNKK